MQSIDITIAYDPSSVEAKWYKQWMDDRIFHSEIDKRKKPYTIVIPPPNVTGILTMGHILNNTIQDIFIRVKRMQGYNACWVPGTDHASIATEAKVTSFLKEKGINKEEIGREEFLKHCWKWKEKYGGLIIQQLKKLGVSCDWERERFTMDDDYYKKVLKAFVKLYNDGKIYRGFRMVNWCPASKSAISDEEVIYKSVQGKLWYLKYPVIGTDKFISVATTRPDTMLGNTGSAVNNEDERFKELGERVDAANRNIPDEISSQLKPALEDLDEYKHTISDKIQTPWYNSLGARILGGTALAASLAIGITALVMASGNGNRDTTT